VKIPYCEKQKGRYKMVAKKITMSFLVLMCFSLVQNITFGAISEASEMEKQEYKHAINQIKSLRKSLKLGKTNHLKSYENFADEIQSKWSRRNKEHYARLMLEICGPLSSGDFKGNRPNMLSPFLRGLTQFHLPWSWS